MNKGLKYIIRMIILGLAVTSNVACTSLFGDPSSTGSSSSATDGGSGDGDEGSTGTGSGSGSGSSSGSSSAVYLSARTSYIDSNYNGELDEIWYYEYNSTDNITYLGKDTDIDGNLDYEENIEYDANNNLTSSTILSGGSTFTYRFDNTLNSDDILTRTLTYLDDELVADEQLEYGSDSIGSYVYISSYDKDSTLFAIQKIYTDDLTKAGSATSYYMLNENNFTYLENTHDSYDNIQQTTTWELAGDYTVSRDKLDTLIASNIKTSDSEPEIENMTYQYDANNRSIIKIIDEEQSANEWKDYIHFNINTYSDGTVLTFTDTDGDHYSADYDCDDNRATATLESHMDEDCSEGYDGSDCNGRDDDCDGEIDESFEGTFDTTDG